MSSWPVAATLAGAVLLSAVTAGIGPEDHTVICGRGHILNRLAQAIMEPLGVGHIDGPVANYCVVPSTAAWLLAAAVFLSVVAVVFFVMGRPHNTPVGPA